MRARGGGINTKMDGEISQLGNGPRSQWLKNEEYANRVT
jgi:hypothetical protein